MGRQRTSPAPLFDHIHNPRGDVIDHPELDDQLAALNDDIRRIVDYYYNGPRHDHNLCVDDDCALCAYHRYRGDEPFDYYAGRDDSPGHGDR